MNGLDITRRVYARLRRPSQQALPEKLVTQTISEVVARRKLDLVLSIQNSEATVSDWFTPTSNDIALEDLGLDVLIPRRLESRVIGSDAETGRDVPTVTMDVLDTNVSGAAAFYGDPMRLAFRQSGDVVTSMEYRLVYEADFAEDGIDLESVVGLPNFFLSYVVLESAWRLLDQVEDSSPEWTAFFSMVAGRWEAQLANDNIAWDKYVRQFKGRAQIPKRTFFQNRSQGPVSNRFRS